MTAKERLQTARDALHELKLGDVVGAEFMTIVAAVKVLDASLDRLLPESDVDRCSSFDKKTGRQCEDLRLHSGNHHAADTEAHNIFWDSYS